MKKKILYISNMFPGHNDQFGVFAKKTAEILKGSNDFEISLFCLIKGRCLNSLINIFRYFALITDSYFKSLILVNRYDIVYIQYIWLHAFYLVGLIKFWKRENKKIVLNFHGEDLVWFERLSAANKKRFILLCINADSIVVPSEYFKAILLDITCVHTIIVFPSGGVDSKIFFLSNKHYPRNLSPVICYTSRFDENKGWDDFIDAVTLLINQKADIKAIMIGFGSQYEEVKNKINTNEIITQSIKLFHNIKREQMNDLYNQSDLFVFPTRLPESLGLVGLEAMSAGLPIVASNIGALPYYVNNNNGFLFIPGSPNDLANKIQKFLNLSVENRIKLSRNALETSEKYFDYNVASSFIFNLKTNLE